MKVAKPRQFPTKSRCRQIGRLRYSVSYGYPGRNGIGLSLCWNPKSQHDVYAASAQNGAMTYTFTWNEIAKVIEGV